MNQADKKDISLRLVRPEDLNQVCDLYYSLWHESEGWSEKSVGNYFAWAFKNQGDMFFVAICDGRVIGVATGMIMPWIKGNALSEVDLFLNREYHGFGIGKKLLGRLVSEAREKYKIAHVLLAADGDKEFPMSWYRRLGLKSDSWILLGGDASEVLKNLSSNI